MAQGTPPAKRSISRIRSHSKVGLADGIVRPSATVLFSKVPARKMPSLFEVSAAIVFKRFVDLSLAVSHTPHQPTAS